MVSDYAMYRLDVNPKPWNKSAEAAYCAITRNLFAVNPVLTQVLNNWYKEYRRVIKKSDREMKKSGG